MAFTNNFKNKRVLVLGLGLLSGGVATANWLMKQGAKVTISDLKSAEELKPSLEKLQPRTTEGTGSSPRLRLGQQSKKDIDDNDIIVVNPGISVHHELVQYAIAHGKKVTNEAVIFYDQWPGKIIGITGTRGKTTTATWTAHLMGDKAVLAGNSPEHPFLNQISNLKNQKWAVTEVSSFHLELFNKSVRAPDIAVLTNIYRDHLNRYDSMEEYAQTKANLYRHQRPGQKLITENDATPEMVKLKLADFEEKWGKHNLINARMAALAAHLAGISWDAIQERITTLPQIPFRQQVVYDDGRLIVINDTAATSPEGGIAALERFGGPDTVLIAGGTDADLDFTAWEKAVAEKIRPEHVVLLAGSATDKIKNQILNIKIFETLKECLQTALALKPRMILFSPACKSFEKFKNEYDRGEQFNKLIQTLMDGHEKLQNSL